MNTNELAKLCEQTVQIVTETAQFLRDELGKVRYQDVETKALNSLVSYVDKTAEEQLVAKLSAILPDSTFLTEEETVEQTKGEYQWIIDPLDGTTNFLHQVPMFAVSVALHHNDEAVIGVVYEVNRDECFAAWKNGGAYLNGSPIKVSNTKMLEESLLATGFPYYDFEWVDPYLAVFRQLIQGTRGLRRCGAAAVDLAYVACGRFDGFYEYSLSAWDMAAGVLLIQEAGGQVSDFWGGDNYLFGKNIVVGNPNIYEDIMKIVRREFAEIAPIE
ncbi:MAG: inositol monophosphatase family protein [Bacteroidota bacterium]